MSAIAPAEALTAELAAYFTGLGYARIEPAMLLPADLVLDHMGEDIRRRLLLTTAPDGSELCLRPDFTLPVALAHIAGGSGQPGRYAYAGLAFRFPANADPLRRSAEFRQAGIEDFGADDALERDGAVVAAAMAAVGLGGLAAPAFTFGDVALHGALIDALGLGEGWAARLRRLFWRRSATGDIVAAVGAQRGEEGSLPALGRALAGLDPPAATALVDEVMSVAGASGTAGRDVAEIAERFARKAGEADGGGPGPEVAGILERFLAIEVPADRAAEALGDFARETGLDLGGSVDTLSRRFALIAGHGVALDKARFATAFGRRIEYYTSHVFEIRSRGAENLGPIASGGRYDRFLADLGAPAARPAVGCSVYVDRLAAAGGRP